MPFSKESSVYSRAIRRLREIGLRRTLVHYAGTCWNLCLSMSPLRLRGRRQQRASDLEYHARRREFIAAIDRRFDSELGLDTGGIIWPKHLDGVGLNWEHGTRYEGVFPEIFRAALDAVKVTPSDFVFLDIGAGKGRAMVMAHDIGFGRIIGIEYSPALVETCKENFHKIAAAGRDYSNVEIHCADACEFQLPTDPLLIFLFNPFGAAVMSQFCSRIVESLAAHPRAVRIIYGNPICDDLLMQSVSGLRRITQSGHFPYFGTFNIYTWDPN
jgi:Methyltransferase domain